MNGKEEDYMQGIIFAILAGFFVSLQNVFNATIGTEISTWSTAMITQLVGGLGATIIYFMKKNDHFSPIKQVKPLYLFGGSFGAIVVATSVLAVGFVGATISNAVLLFAQLLVVVLIEAFGLFEMKKQPIERKHIVGLLFIMMGAIIVMA
jgi:bacterial/archaeal transporter family-2 protein